MQDKKVVKYIEKQKSYHKEICNKLRYIVSKTFPNINKEMKWGVPSYNIGKCYFVTLKTHFLNSFSYTTLSSFHSSRSISKDLVHRTFQFQVNCWRN